MLLETELEIEPDALVEIEELLDRELEAEVETEELRDSDIELEVEIDSEADELTEVETILRPHQRAFSSITFLIFLEFGSSTQ